MKNEEWTMVRCPQCGATSVAEGLLERIRNEAARTAFRLPQNIDQLSIDDLLRIGCEMTQRLITPPSPEPAGSTLRPREP